VQNDRVIAAAAAVAELSGQLRQIEQRCAALLQENDRLRDQARGLYGQLEKAQTALVAAAQEEEA
jgi:hypothetical protein